MYRASPAGAARPLSLRHRHRRRCRTKAAGAAPRARPAACRFAGHICPYCTPEVPSRKATGGSKQQAATNVCRRRTKLADLGWLGARLGEGHGQFARSVPVRAPHAPWSMVGADIAIIHTTVRLPIESLGDATDKTKQPCAMASLVSLDTAAALLQNHVRCNHSVHAQCGHISAPTARAGRAHSSRTARSSCTGSRAAARR